MENNILTLYGSSSTLPVFISLFLIIYLFGYFVVFRNWTDKHRAEACSCFMSLAHGTPAVFLASFSILMNSQGNYASPNTQFQDIVLEYSIAYFVMDILHYLVFFPTDVLFIAHHLATLYVFITCRYIVHHGAIPILVLLVLAEITSACQNTWSLARYRKSDVPAAARYYEFLSPLFYAFYTVVRGILGPLFVYKMGVFYASGAADGIIPSWAWVSWMCVIGCAISVSIFWVSDHWMKYNQDRNKKVQKKQQYFVN